MAAILQLLDVLDVENCIVTIDAMVAQKEIAVLIIEKGKDVPYEASQTLFPHQP
ncbi:MAG: hypothetical protein WA949_08075 [Phormidesmis sp.]